MAWLANWLGSRKAEREYKRISGLANEIAGLRRELEVQRSMREQYGMDINRMLERGLREDAEWYAGAMLVTMRYVWALESVLDGQRPEKVFDNFSAVQSALGNGEAKVYLEEWIAKNSGGDAR